MQLSSSKRKTFLSFQPPAIGPEEIAAVTETLESGWLTSGPRAEELERRLAELTGARHALALASGTAAMHLSLVGLGIGAGDEVITTPITWPATANVIVHTGATPVFVDVRDADLNVDPELALRAMARRFADRVERAEQLATEDGHAFAELSLDEQDRYFDAAKEALR